MQGRGRGNVAAERLCGALFVGLTTLKGYFYINLGGTHVATKMKDEITYKPQNDATFGQQSGSHADFTYSISGNVISITDAPEERA